MVIVSLFVAVGCCGGDKDYAGTRVEALDNAAWEASKWISVVDAPVVTEAGAFRAADGANWFITTLKNEKKVVSAKWMATSLGVFDIYVNGKIVGAEVLKHIQFSVKYFWNMGEAYGADINLGNITSNIAGHSAYGVAASVAFFF